MENYFFCDDLEEALERIKACSLEIPSIESCGFLGYNSSKKVFSVGLCDNKSPEPETSFVISPYDYIDFLKKNKIICIFHSHPEGESDPSDVDKAVAKNTLFPCLIYGLSDGSFSLIKPKMIKKIVYKKGLKELEEKI